VPSGIDAAFKWHIVERSENLLSGKPFYLYNYMRVKEFHTKLLFISYCGSTSKIIYTERLLLTVVAKNIELKF